MDATLLRELSQKSLVRLPPLQLSLCASLVKQQLFFCLNSQDEIHTWLKFCLCVIFISIFYISIYPFNIEVHTLSFYIRAYVHYLFFLAAR